MRLRSLLASAHLSLIKSIVRGDGVLVSWHSDAHLALLEQWASHRLLGLLSRWWRVDHLLRFQEQLIDSILAFDGCPTAHAMDIVGLNGHFLGVDEFVDHGFAVGRRRVRHETAVVRTLGVVPHHHLLGRGSCRQFGLNLTTT